MTRLEEFKKMLADDGVKDEAIIENKIDNATILSIAFDGDDKDANTEYLMSIAIAETENYIESVHVTKDLVLTKENIVKTMRAVNEMNVESIGPIFYIDFEDKALTASIYANATQSVADFYETVMDTMEAAVENFKKV